MAKRACLGSTTKGQPCKAAALTGSDYCRAHDLKRPDEDRFGSPVWSAKAGASAKPHVPKLTEALIEVLFGRAHEIADELLRQALEADKPVMVGSGDDAFIERNPDDNARRQAIALIFDRAEGKARQSVELSGRDGGPIEHAQAKLADLTDEQIAALEAIHADDPE